MAKQWDKFNVDQVPDFYEVHAQNPIPLSTRTYGAIPVPPADPPIVVQPPAPVPPATYTVTTDVLNVRAAPSLTAPVMTKVRRGTKLIKRVDVWKAVMLPDGRAGWVHGDFVE